MFDKLRKLLWAEHIPEAPPQVVPSTLDLAEPSLDDLVAENIALGEQGAAIRTRRIELQKQISSALLAQRPHKGT